MIHERKQVQTCISRDRNRVRYGRVSVALWTVIVCLTVLYYSVISLFCMQCFKKVIGLFSLWVEKAIFHHVKKLK